MKIRRGFVSNSSSSSFIIGFKKDQNPKDKKFLKELLFNNNDSFMAEYSTEWLDTEVALNWIMNELNEYPNPLTAKQAAKIITDGWYSDPRIPEFDYVEHAPYPREGTKEEQNAWREANHRRWNEQEAAQLVGATEVAKEFLDKHPDLDFYEMHFADGDGVYGSTLEHGSIWDQTTHLKISNH